MNNASCECFFVLFFSSPGCSEVHNEGLTFFSGCFLNNRSMNSSEVFECNTESSELSLSPILVSVPAVTCLCD